VNSTEDRKQLATYLLLTFAFTSIFYFLIIKSGHLSAASGMYVLGIMWSPATAAILTCKLFGRDLGTLGWKWGKARYQVASYLIPLGYATVAYLFIWVFRLGGFYDHEFVSRLTQRFGLGPLPNWASISLYFALAATVGMIRSCASALGEEIGWRGFLVPQLSKMMGFTSAALISGIIWSLWHYPILIFADYNAGTPTWYGLTCFTVMVISISFVFAWMRLKSGSLWTGVLLHASHNLFIQSFFTPMTTNTGRTAYFTDEFGCVLPVVSLALAIYFWSRRREVVTSESSAVEMKAVSTASAG
jgi:membrane protease YdiL (CAAX protease family)